MRLYHFTDAWPAIQSSGAINPTWNRHGSPRTVHFTTSTGREALPWGGLRGSRYRIAVDIPDVDLRPWQPWVHRYLPPEEWWSLASPDNQWNGDPDSWYVTERAVPADEWISVFDCTEEREIWGRGA